MTNLTREQQAAALEKDWAENPRWKGIKRGYSAADVVRLRGSLEGKEREEVLAVIRKAMEMRPDLGKLEAGV